MKTLSIRPPFRLLNSRLAQVVLGLLLLAGTSGCQENRVFEQNQAVGPEWAWGEIRRFEVNIRDTASLYNLFINARHTEQYAYSNCWLSIQTIGPGGDTLNARVELRLAEADGTWRGECNTAMCLQRELIGPGQRFPQPGTYTFLLEQDMRENPLTGLQDIGIRLEKLGSGSPVR
jgi:gliding motility-associated lipoprotein GldH